MIVIRILAGLGAACIGVFVVSVILAVVNVARTR